MVNDLRILVYLLNTTVHVNISYYELSIALETTTIFPSTSYCCILYIVYCISNVSHTPHLAFTLVHLANAFGPRPNIPVSSPFTTAATL